MPGITTSPQLRESTDTTKRQDSPGFAREACPGARAGADPSDASSPQRQPQLTVSARLQRVPPECYQRRFLQDVLQEGKVPMSAAGQELANVQRQNGLGLDRRI